MREKSFVIQCEPKMNLAAGYTKVKIMPGNHAKLVIIAGITGKPIQHLVDELLEKALENVSIRQYDGSIIDLGGILE